MSVEKLKRNYEFARKYSFRSAFYSMSEEAKIKAYREKEHPTHNDRMNMNSQRKEGISFYEAGNRIDNMSLEELKQLGYYFKQGYEIAKRREYARTLSNKRN